jgi:hypothetical protein
VITRNNVIIVGTVQVSAGGWMPILSIYNPPQTPPASSVPHKLPSSRCMAMQDSEGIRMRLACVCGAVENARGRPGIRLVTRGCKLATSCASTSPPAIRRARMRQVLFPFIKFIPLLMLA